MFLAAGTIPFPSVSRHIQHDLYPHRLLLAIRQVSIPDWKLLQLLIIHPRHLSRIYQDQLVLLIPMAHESRQPSPIRLLFKKETEPAVALGVDLTPVNYEALRDGRLHLRNGARRPGVDVRGRAVDAVHDKGTLVHSGLRDFDEVLVVRPPSPRGVDVSIHVED